MGCALGKRRGRYGVAYEMSDGWHASDKIGTKAQAEATEAGRLMPSSRGTRSCAADQRLLTRIRAGAA